ncbi:MAG: hypothetical protein AAB401_13680, partial [Acidobacteriota bacterium]
MELPIFNDNLKSSGSWSATLAAEKENWKQAGASAELLREYQIEHLLRRAGNNLDRANLIEAARKISGWAAEPVAKFSPERLMELHETLTGAKSELRKNEPRPINAL